MITFSHSPRPDRPTECVQEIKMFEDIISDLSCTTGYIAIAALILGLILIAVSFYMGNPYVLAIGVIGCIFGAICILIATGVINWDAWPFDLSTESTTTTTPETSS